MRCLSLILVAACLTGCEKQQDKILGGFEAYLYMYPPTVDVTLEENNFTPPVKLESRKFFIVEANLTRGYVIYERDGVRYHYVGNYRFNEKSVILQ